MSRTAPHHQRGAALAIALLMLVIVTLLGVAAVRATQVELKLAQNAESRMTAVQSAESMVGFLLKDNTYLPVNGNESFVACFRATGLSTPQFTCPSTETPIVATTATAELQRHGYARVRREAPLFVEVNVLREQGDGAGIGAKNYDFARFTAVGGFDRSAEGLSAAEVIEGTLQLHTKVTNVNFEP